MTHVWISVVDHDDPWVSCHFEKCNGARVTTRPPRGFVISRYAVGMCKDSPFHGVLELEVKFEETQK